MRPLISIVAFLLIAPGVPAQELQQAQLGDFKLEITSVELADLVLTTLEYLNAHTNRDQIFQQIAERVATGITSGGHNAVHCESAKAAKAIHNLLDAGGQRQQ